jgi:hypothetical protein
MTGHRIKEISESPEQVAQFVYGLTLPNQTS